MTKKKVIFFTSPEVGGAERMTITIAKMLSTDQYDIRFVVIGHQKGNIVKFIPPELPVGLLKIRNIYDFTTIKLYRLMRKERPDVVFCSLIYLSIRVIQAAKWAGGIKVIVRNNIGLSVIAPLTLRLCRYTYPKADVVIAQQEEMREELLQYLPLEKNKVVTLHNPIDTKTLEEKVKAETPYPNQNKTNYVWVGRVSREKGQDILIKAFHTVYAEDREARLYFVGKYDKNDVYYQSLVSLTDQMGLSEVVTFVGFDSNPYRWVMNCNCFVQPSRLEGLPNALIEAMYLGKPVVATRCIPVVDRIVEDGYNGYVVDSEDVEGMSKAMLLAVKLKDYKMTYKSASKEDFIQLF